MEQARIYAVLWEITMSCNLACRYCYNMFQTARPSSRAPSTSREEAFIIAKRILEAGIRTVVLSGGEPLTTSQTVVEVGRFLRQHGVKVSVITNGTLMTKDLAERLFRADVEVFVSLTAPCESLHDELVNKPGAYRRTVDGIKTLVSKGVRTGVNMVVTQRNKDMVRELGFLVSDMGVNAFSASRLIPPWDSHNNKEISSLLLGRADVKKMFDDLKVVRQCTNLLVYTQSCYPLCLMADFSAPVHLKYCSIGGPALAIGPRGEIRPCALMPHICGNVLTEGFEPSLKRMRVWRVESITPPQCQSCQVFEQCKGGCRITAHFAGDVSGLDMHADPHALAMALGCDELGG